MADGNSLKVETKRHIEAFDKYYAMGEDRKLASLVSYCDVTETTVKRWSRSFNWQMRIAQRDLENGKKIMAKTDRVVVDTKAEYRKDIKLILQRLKGAVNKVVAENPETHELEVKLNMSDGKQLAAVVGAIDKMIKTDLLLIGEADSRADNTVQGQITLEDIVTYGRRKKDAET